jgi:hypothetical protein
MTNSKDANRAKSKKAGKTSQTSKKSAKSSKSNVKKEGTRFNTKVDVRGTSKKGGAKGSRDRLRDGT